MSGGIVIDMRSLQQVHSFTEDYPFAAVELTRGDWRHHYGARWQELAKAKRQYDPDTVFASGPQLYFT